MKIRKFIDRIFSGDIRLLLLISVILMGLVIVSLRARGDEPGVYLPVIISSIKAWPLLNINDVSYGVSPIWTWLVGFVGQFLTPLLSGRSLSLLAWIGALYIYYKQRGSIIGLDVFLLFFNPFCFLFAMRCHPYWLGVMLLLAGCYYFISASRKSWLCIFSAVSVQNFLMVSASSIFVYDKSGYAKKVQLLIAFLLVVGFGVISNWLLYGGRYPENFKISSYYLPYLNFDGFTESYLPLLTGFFGWFSLIFRQSNQSHEPSYLFKITLFTILLMLFHDTPIGPLFNSFGALGPEFVFIGKSIVTLGCIWLFRHGLAFAAVAIVTAFLLSTLPFFYERYVWFMILPIYMVRAIFDPSFESISMSAFSRRIASLMIVLVSIFFSFKGSL